MDFGKKLLTSTQTNLSLETRFYAPHMSSMIKITAIYTSRKLPTAGQILSPSQAARTLYPPLREIVLDPLQQSLRPASATIPQHRLSQLTSEE